MRWPYLLPLCIGGEANPYMRRWYILPRNNFFCIYLHQVLRSDDPRALHDHPGDNISIVLCGGYREVLFFWKPVEGVPLPLTYEKIRRPGSVVFRRAELPHRLVISDGARPSWSLFIFLRKRRNWYFWCSGVDGARMVPWQEYTAGAHNELVGRGCG